MRNGKPEQATVTLVAKFVPTSGLTPDPTRRDSSVHSEETLVIQVLRANELRKADMFGQNDGKIRKFLTQMMIIY